MAAFWANGDSLPFLGPARGAPPQPLESPPGLAVAHVLRPPGLAGPLLDGEVAVSA